MTLKIASLFAVLAILFLGSFVAAQDASASSTIKLSLFPSSSEWWIAVDPVGDDNATATVELQESSSSEWVQMQSNPSWGYFQLSATDGNGFDLPLSFRLTSAAGEQLVLTNVLTSLGGALLDSAQQFTDDSNGHHANPPTEAPTKRPSGHNTPAPTEKPTQRPTQKPTQHATPAPTQRPSSSGHGQAPTAAPTTRPSSSGHNSPTSAPTQKPTQPTQHATPAPTQKPSKGSSSSSGSSSSGSSSVGLCDVVPTSSEPMKILVPLYVDPGKEWDELITAAATGVPIMAIINPDDGPVSSGPDSSYKTYMQKFAAAGIEMVGYVHTLYGDRSLSDVEADVATYASKYPGLIGVFVDEVSAEASDLSYYNSLFASVKSHTGYVNTILNPGTMPDEGYMNAGTNVMVFESPASSFKSNDFESWVSCAPSAAAKTDYKYKFSAIAYGASQSTMTSVVSQMQAAGMGLVYVTDGAGGCCTYNDLTSYFAQLAAAVKALN